MFGYLAAVYKRTWRGSIIGRFLSPLFFPLAMGLGLGALVDDRAGGVDGTPYLLYVVPAIVATQAMWVAMGESTYQVLGYIKWNMGYHAMLASPLGIRDILIGHLLSIVGHLTVATAIFMGVAALFGGFASWWAVLCLPIAVLTGMAFTVPIFAFTARQEGDNGFNILFRWVMTPLMLFSGTYAPSTACRSGCSRSPGSRRCGTASSPAARCRLRRGGLADAGAVPGRAGRLHRGRVGPGRALLHEEAGRMSVTSAAPRTATRLARLVPMPAGAGLARMLVERNVTSFRHGWIALVTGFAEPVFYLFSLGVGIGALVQTVVTDEGTEVSLPRFCRPCAAGCLGDERRCHGLDVQRLLQPEVRTALRLGARDADGPARHSPSARSRGR